MRPCSSTVQVTVGRRLAIVERTGNWRGDDWILALLVVGALGLGGWWWVGNAPGLGTDRIISRMDTELAGEIRLVDPHTGQVVAARVAVEDGPGALPSLPETALRRSVVMRTGDVRSWTVRAGAGERFLVRYACSGAPDGRLRLMVVGRLTEPLQAWIRCDGSFASDEVVATGGSLRVSVSGRWSGSPRLVVQLVRLS